MSTSQETALLSALKAYVLSILPADVDSPAPAPTPVPPPPPAPAPPPPAPPPGDILNADGSVNTAAYISMAGVMSQTAGIAYRFGPDAASLGTAPYTTTLFEPAHNSFRNGLSQWEVGHLEDGWETNNQAAAGLYSTDQANVCYVPDDSTARVGVALLQVAGHEYNVEEESPQLAWQVAGWSSGNGLDTPTAARLKSSNVLPSGVSPTCGTRVSNRAGFSNQGIVCFQNGLVIGVGSNTANNTAWCQLAANKVPTSIAITGMDEFAFVTVWDTSLLKGQVAVIALAGLGDGATISNPVGGYTNQGGWWGEWTGVYPGLPNMGNFGFMKVLGYVDLPGMMAPIGIAVSNGLDPFNTDVGGTFMGWGLSPLSTAANWQSFVPGAPNNGRFAKGGCAVIISKSEQKACFLDLAPLFQFFANQYFTASGNPTTSSVGSADNQWPFTFSNSPSQTPVLVKTVSLPQRPTAVRTTTIATGASSRAFIATQDGVITIYGLGGYVPGAGVPSPLPITSDIVVKGSVIVGRNPTCLAAGKNEEYLESLDSVLIVTSRGDRKIQWVHVAADGSGGTITRTIQDSRLVDPIAAEDADDFANDNELVTVCDYAGKAVRNYRYGSCVFSETTPFPSGAAVACPGPNGCPVTPTSGISVEHGGSFTLPGKPFMVNSGNVP